MRDSLFTYEKFYLIYKVGRLAFSVGLLVLLFSVASVSRVVFLDRFSLIVLTVYASVSLFLFIVSRRPRLFEFILDELFLFLLAFKGAFSYTFFSIFLFFPVFFSQLFLGGNYGYFTAAMGIVLHFVYFSLVSGGFDFFSLTQFILNSSALVLMMLASKKLKSRFEAQEAYIKALEREREDIELYKRLYEISADLAHELKNPLASIKGAVELLIEGKKSERLLGIIAKETERLDSVIKDFLNLARPSYEERTPLNLYLVVRDVLSSLDHLEKRVDFRGEGEVMVLADPRVLRSAVDNLIRNAFQWAKSRVKIRVFQEGGWATLTVEDDGPGIDEAEKNRIFEPFFSKRKEGSGLGLAVVKKFAIENGGFVFAGSSSLGGAKFTLKLPLLKERDEGSGS